jgi:peptide deformylase
MDLNYIDEGKILKIFTYPSPILKKIATNVEVFDDELKELCRNMLTTMYDAPGIGLAAPQVGISKRIFVMDVEFDRKEVTAADGQTKYEIVDRKPLIFINPVIKNKEGQFKYEEGCLSLPGIYDEVTRAKKITLEYQDLEGNKKEIEAEDLFAVCIQHENDHLDGVVFIERLSMLKKNFFHKKLVKRKKMYSDSP